MILNIEDDFDLEKIASSGQCFRWTRMDDGSYRIIQGGECVYMRDLGRGRFDIDCDEDGFRGIWYGYFDLDEDYRSIRGRIDPGVDQFLWRAAEDGKGIRILRQDPWETLVSFIISQNRNIPAIQRSIELLCQACGNSREDDRGNTYYAFPSAEAIASLGEAELERCSLGYRGKYVRAAAASYLDGEIDFESLKSADEPETIGALTKLFGVGVKVASCVSLFGLHHVDAFPIDVWIKRVLENEYPEGYPYERYRPFNGVYQQYLFAYYRNQAPAR